MKPGDVVLGAFPGAQVTKTRPAVVLSTEDYHRHRPDVVVGLITTQTPMPLAPTDCPLLDWKQAGLQREVRVIGRLSDADWASVRGCFRAGFGDI